MNNMKYLVLIIFLLVSTLSYAQTAIEMSNPNDADVVLLQVSDTSIADVIIYCSNDKSEWQQWDCMWKVRSGGFSNFSFYLAQSEDDTLLFTDDSHIPILISGRVYFTHNKLIRGYRKPGLYIDGIMKVKRIKK